MFDMVFPQLDLDVDEKPVPGRFLLTNIHATDITFDSESEQYWPCLVLNKSQAPSKVERDLYATRNDLWEEYLIWLIGKSRL